MRAEHRMRFLSRNLPLAQFIRLEAELLADAPLDVDAPSLVAEAERQAALALTQRGTDAFADFHKALYELLSWRIAPVPHAGERSPLLFAVRRRLETAWIAEERRRIHGQATPSDPSLFETWFFELVKTHPAARHAVYDHIAQNADLAAFRAFVEAESTVDARFDDLLALTQLGTSGRAKMEIARNFWDEMGEGEPRQVHTTMFAKMYTALDLDAARMRAPEAEALACGSLLLLFASYRTFFDHAIGALGVTEALAPFRFHRVIQGWSRLGLDEDALDYYRLHLHVDTEHTAGWLTEVVKPTLEERPEALPALCEGVLMRLATSLEYCGSLQRDLAVC